MQCAATEARVHQDILNGVMVGFLAQSIDGALGMGYGVTSTTFLLSIGFPPSVASACVHTAEVCTTGVSGLSHVAAGNVNKDLFRRLVVPGVVGGVLGAYVLTCAPAELMRPLVSVYLLIMGIVIVRKAIFKKRAAKPIEKLAPLGLAGGFLDAVGGGGWGPVVTSTLVANGHYEPNEAIGSVNTAEFFVTLATAAAFFATLGQIDLGIISGLIIGGILAAPFAAFTCKLLPPRALTALVGALIVVLSVRSISAFAASPIVASTINHALGYKSSTPNM